MVNQKGTALIPIIILVGIVLSGTITWMILKPQRASLSVTPASSAIPKPTLVPKIGTIPLTDCVGPDGKHAQLTLEDCDNLGKAWASATPKPNK